MATNWSGYEAEKEIMGSDKENIAEIGSRFPLFTRTVACANNDYLLDILKAIPKVTARVIETGLKEIDDVETEVEDAKEKDEAPKKSAKKETKTTQKPKSKKFAEEDDEAIADKMADKICRLRIFEDENEDIVEEAKEVSLNNYNRFK